MSRENSRRPQAFLKVDMEQLFAGLRKTWQYVLIFCLLAASAGFLFALATHVPTYTSDTTFVVSNKTVGVLNESKSMTLSDFSASSALANTFKFILLSDEAMDAVISTYGLHMSVNSLKSCISITPVLNTNILEMTVTTHDAVLSRNIANKVIEYYPAVLDKTIKYASLEVLNPPMIAPTADKYNGSIIYSFLGFFAAACVSFLYIYLRQAFRDTIKTVSDISVRADMNLLASVPKVKAPKSYRKTQKGLYISDQAASFPFVESYKALRTKIELLAAKKGYKTFVVTSSLENEGKTTVAVNLSIALAENNRNVLLIDADLRKPSLYSFAGLPYLHPEIGIDQVLQGVAPYEAAVTSIKEFGVSALLTVKESANSSELLSSAKMKDLLAKASKQYDYVIIDSSPASILTDSVVMTAYTDAVILTIRQDYAPFQLVDSVAQSLSGNGADLIGCVFNIVDDGGFIYRKYGYHSFHHYGSYTLNDVGRK